MENEHKFVRKNMERAVKELNSNMTIKEFLILKKESLLKEVNSIKDFEGKDLPTKKGIREFAIELASNMSEVYDKGFEDALKFIQQCDYKFLSRELPPHLKR